MRSDDPNLPHLLVIANALGELCEHVVFLGGAVVGLLVSDPLAEGVRATYDVDAVVNLDWSGSAVSRHVWNRRVSRARCRAVSSADGYTKRRVSSST